MPYRCCGKSDIIPYPLVKLIVYGKEFSKGKKIKGFYQFVVFPIGAGVQVGFGF